jgi:hypothetical protein
MPLKAYKNIRKCNEVSNKEHHAKHPQVQRSAIEPEMLRERERKRGRGEERERETRRRKVCDRESR